MICLQCDNEEFVAKLDAVIQQEFKGELLDVHTPALACSKCGWLTVDLDQAEELRRRTADAYRKKHGLLTSDAIKAIRKVLGKNQCEFADFLGVGEASVKRWETWLVQEKGNDELIRLKFDQHIREQDAQKTTTGMWISFNYDNLVEAANGVTIQQIPSPMPFKLPRWKLNFDYAEPGEESQMPLVGMGNPIICGLSPPGGSEVAFSFSAPCPNQFGKDFEKENVDYLKNSRTN